MKMQFIIIINILKKRSVAGDNPITSQHPRQNSIYQGYLWSEICSPKCFTNDDLCFFVKASQVTKCTILGMA